MRHIYFIIITSFILFTSCNKEHLPEYYFKCKVNGQEYVRIIVQIVKRHI